MAINIHSMITIPLRGKDSKIRRGNVYVNAQLVDPSLSILCEDLAMALTE